MSATALTIVTLSRLLAPVFKDLYAGAKGQAEQALIKISTVAGVKKLASTLIKIDKVKTIWSAEDEVSLKKFYYPSKVSIDDEDQTINSEQDLPKGNLVIEGIVGQGKSIFMRHLACSLLSEPTIKKIPFLLELRNISKKRTLHESINSFLKTVGIAGGEETFAHLALSNKIVLLLDGFDEVPEECVTDIIIEVDALQMLYPDLKIIISSRPQSHIQNLVGFRILRLVPLMDVDYDPFVKKLIPSTAKRTDVVDALNACPADIKGIISTPLMLTLVIVVYQTEKEIPLSLSEFFDKLFGIVFTKHDKLKAGFNRQHYSGLAERRLRQLFDAFCFMVVQTGGGRSLTPSKFNRAFDGALKLAKGCDCEVEDFRKDIVKVACLLIEEGLDLATFLHKSILDYHAAAFIKELPDARAKTFYQAAIKDHRKWQSALTFLKIIDQTRYANHYFLNVVTEPFQKLSDALNAEGDKSLLKYLITFEPEVSVGFHDHMMVSWGPTRQNKNEIEEEIASTLMRHVVFLTARAAPSDIDFLTSKDTATTDKKMNAVLVPLRDLIERFGLDTFRTALRSYENETYREIENYKSIVAHESTQASIFDDILGTGTSDTVIPRKKVGASRKR